MSTQIVSKKLHVSAASDFIYSVKNDDAYYVFAAKHTQYDNGDSTAPTPTDSVQNNHIQIYDDMLFGKRVTSNDIVPMIPRYDWTTGTEYSMYDDTDSQLFTKQFYACVNTGSQYHVYKCLYNGGGVPSTEEPTGTLSTWYESPSDGYIWKYMYSADSATEAKFATSSYLPVVVNTSVTAAATPGAIDVIKVEDGGAGYNNYLVSSFATAGDIRVGGDERRYALGANAENTPDFYNNCLLLITSGAAEDEYRIITDYVIEDGRRIAVLNEPFENTVAVNDQFEVYPFVDVFDNGGRKNVNCIARAMISSSAANAVSNIDILEPGSGYRSAVAVIRAASAVGVSSEAVLRPIMSPADGHGAHVADELGANFVGISVKFIENEGVGPEFLPENDFRQIGILKNPLFANVEITYSAGNTVGSFLGNENIYQYERKQLTGTVNTYSTTSITGNDTVFQDWLSAGDRVIITNGTENVFANVASIASNTSLTLDASATFTSQTCNIYYVDAVAYGVVSANSDGIIYVANVNVATTTTSSRFVGEDSSATTIADTIRISRGGSTPDLRVTNNFYTFSQLTKFAGTVTDGTFEEDELITQPDQGISFSRPSARLFAAVNSESGTDFLYATNVKNVWQTGALNGVTTGNSSQAQFVVSAKYEGELVPGSGEVVYIENLLPISRNSSQTETIKLILEL